MYYKLTVKEYTIYLYPSSITEKCGIEEAIHRGEPLRDLVIDYQNGLSSHFKVPLAVE